MGSRCRGTLVTSKLCHPARPGVMPSVREEFWLCQWRIEPTITHMFGCVCGSVGQSLESNRSLRAKDKNQASEGESSGVEEGWTQ
jgi:hypothetical protein